MHRKRIPRVVYKIARPPTTPIAPRAHPATVCLGAHALLVAVEAAEPLGVPLDDVPLAVPLGRAPPLKLADTPVLFLQCES